MTASVASGGPQAADDTRISSDDDGPSRKRMRVSRACDACRRRKERCDGTQPSCQRCKAVGRPCSYNPYRKRGLRTGYVRGTEILLGLLLHTYADAEDLIVSVLQNRAASHTLPQHATSTAAPAAASLLDAWRKSSALGQLQRNLAVSEPDEDDEAYLQNLDDKLTSAFNALPRRFDDDDDGLDSTPTAIEASEVENHAPPNPISPGLPSVVQDGSVPTDVVRSSTLVLPPNWTLLVDIYSSHTHSWLPIIHRHSLLRTASLLNQHAGDMNSSKEGRPSPGEIASLWATLALASDQLENCNPSDDTVPHGHFRHGLASSQLYQTAQSLAVQDPPCYDAGHVHAFLVMSLLDMSRGSWTKAWFWVGRAVYVAISLNMVPLPNHGERQRTDDMSKRLFLGCFILDTLVSIRLGHRPHLCRADLDAAGDISVDGLEEWEPWRPLLHPPHGTPAASGAPGRALSVFSNLGYLAGVFNGLHQLPLDSASGPDVIGLLDDLTERLKTMPPINIPRTSQGNEAAIATEPPYFINLRIAAAAAYVTIKSWAAKSPAASAQSADADLPVVLLSALDFLKSTSVQSPVFASGWLPGTSPIFFHLLHECGAASPDAHLRADWPGSKQHASDHHRIGYLGDAPSMLSMPAVPTGDDHQLLMSLMSLNNGHHPRNPQALANEADTLFTSSSVLAPAHRGTIQQSFQAPEQLQTQQQQPPSADHQTRSSDVAPPIASPNVARHHPEVQPTGRDDAMTAQAGTADASTAAIAMASDTAADADGLFNQLALLDTADWHASSADFMEHLGLSRDGSFVDFNTLFS